MSAENDESKNSASDTGTLTLGLWLPPRASLCLCGSGNRFKKCCGDLWNNNEFRGEFESCVARNDLPGALTRLRAQISRYRICHHRNTIPFLKSGHPLAQELLETDIEALSEYLEQLLRLYWQLEPGVDCRSLVEFFEFAIDDSGWSEKIALLRLLASLTDRWDEERGLEEARRLGAPEQFNDPGLLSVLLDLRRDDLSFARLIALAQKVIEKEEDPFKRLHYRLYVGSVFLQLSDIEGAKEEVLRGLAEIASHAQDRPSLPAYALEQLASANDLANSLTDDRKYGELAIDIWGEILDRKVLTEQGLQSLWRRRGETFRQMGEFESARWAFEQCVAFGGSIGGILLAEIDVLQLAPERALRTLKAIDRNALSDAEKADHAFAFARAVLSSNAVAEFELASELLESSPVRGAIFDLQRVQLKGALSRLPDKVPQDEGPKGLLGLIARYTDLKPGIFGLGLNLNAMLEDFRLRRARRQDMPDD